MKTITVKPWDAADHLRSDADVVAYLDAALEDGNPGPVTSAPGRVARARGVAAIAKATRA